MDSKAARLRGEITAALARYEQWERPLRTYRGGNAGRVDGGALSWEEFDRGLRALEASLREQFDPRSELHPLFERLCAEYVASDAAGRDQTRQFAARQQKLGPLLGRYANGLAASIPSLGAEPVVLTALAATSIENCAADVRDTLMTLADLYVAAETAGVASAPLFAAAAEWSTDEWTPGGCESLARTLREFPECSVLRERRVLGAPYGGPT